MLRIVATEPKLKTIDRRYCLVKDIIIIDYLSDICLSLYTIEVIVYLGQSCYRGQVFGLQSIWILIYFL